jgi:hypothetical protein
MNRPTFHLAALLGRSPPIEAEIMLGQTDEPETFSTEKRHKIVLHAWCFPVF